MLTGSSEGGFEKGSRETLKPAVLLSLGNSQPYLRRRALSFGPPVAVTCINVLAAGGSVFCRGSCTLPLVPPLFRWRDRPEDLLCCETDCEKLAVASPGTVKFQSHGEAVLGEADR